MNGVLSRNDRQVIHDADVRRTTFRRTEKCFSGYVSCGFERRKIVGAIDQLAGTLQPVLREAGLETHCTRPFNADLDIVPMAVILRGSRPLIGDAGSAGERHTAIDDHRFAMVAMIEVSNRPQPDPVVPVDFAAALLQDVQYFVADR